MENTDSTVIATSLPAIAEDIGSSPISLKLALTSYMVSLAVFIPISGWMADRFGARTVFRLAMVVFMAGSIACALASSLEGFVAARFFQGMGGAMMVPVGRLVLLRTVPKSELVAALAYLTVPALVGPVIGPPLGGFITTYFDWRWIFLINIPIGIVGIILATVFIENIREEDVAPLDVTGAILAGGGLATLMLAFSSGGGHLISRPVAIALGLLGAALLGLYLAHARRVATPVFKLALLRISTFRVSVLSGSLFRIGAGAIPFLLPLMLQEGFGMTPVHSGMITFISAVGALFTKTLATRILRRYGFRRVLGANLLFASVFVASYGFFDEATPLAIMMGTLFIGGCLRSMQFTAFNAIAYADIEPKDMSFATSLYAVAQQLSLAIGVALGAAALQFSALLRTGDAEAIAAPDFLPAFLVVGAVSALGILLIPSLRADAGAEMSGHISQKPGDGAARKATAEAVQQHPRAGEG